MFARITKYGTLCLPETLLCLHEIYNKHYYQTEGVNGKLEVDSVSTGFGGFTVGVLDNLPTLAKAVVAVADFWAFLGSVPHSILSMAPWVSLPRLTSFVRRPQAHAQVGCAPGPPDQNAQ